MPSHMLSHQAGLQPGRDIGRLHASRRFDVTFCALAILVLMANNILGPLAPVLILVLTGAYLVVNARRCPQIVASCWPLLLLPMLVLASSTWSIYPSLSIRYGSYYLLTVTVGLMMGAGVRKEDLLKGIFLGLLVSHILGFLLGRYVVIGTTGELAFAGVQGSKNAAGEAAGVALLVSGAMIARSVQQRSLGWFAAAALGMLLASSTLLLSKATGAVIAALVAATCLLIWITSRKLPRQARATILLIGVVALSGLAATSSYWMPAMFDLVLDTSGKDAGLTGRDLLWRKADMLIDERPWFGRGYNAFWVHNNPDAEYLWREMSIPSRRGFNFHNTYREITVDLGYVGLTIFTVITLVSSFVLLIRTMVSPSIPLIMASSILIYLIFKVPFETFGFAGMHLLSMFAYLILAMGLSSLLRAGNESPRRRRSA